MKRKQQSQASTTLLKDICGYAEEKLEVQKIISLLNDYEKYDQQGVNIPRGLIFQGPPGTGKTLFAKAIAGECHYNFYTVFSSELDENPLATVKQVFKDAEAYVQETNKPSIVYIDEIDKLVYTNNYGDLADTDSREATRFLLQKLDETKLKNKILIVASTNEYRKIPEALLRSGRFDKKILIDLPDVSSREDILKYYINKHPLFKNIDVSKLALKTYGMSGADIKTLINNTLLEYVTVKKHIELDDFIKIINEMNFETIGKQWKSSKTALEILAHEIGHALVSYEFFKTFGTVSAIKYGCLAGSTVFDEIDDDDFEPIEEAPRKSESNETLDKCINNICVAFGGMAGERVYLNEHSFGNGADLNEVCERIGRICDVGGFGFYWSRSIDDYGASEKWRDRYHRYVVKLCNKYYRKSIKIVKKNKILGLYLVDEIHQNNDVLSAEVLKEKRQYFLQHKKEFIKKYKKLHVLDLDK